MSYHALMPMADWNRLVVAKDFRPGVPLRAEIWGWRDYAFPRDGWIIFSSDEATVATAHLYLARWDEETKSWRTAGKTPRIARQFLSIAGGRPGAYLAKIVGQSSRAEGDQRIYDIEIYHPGTAAKKNPVLDEAPPLPKSPDDIVP